MSFYQFILHAHSFIRYVALVSLFIAIVNSLNGFVKESKYTSADQKISLIALISFHVQFLLGLILYFISPKVQFSKFMLQNNVLRFFTMEHAVMMLISVALVTIGYILAKRSADAKGHKQILIFFLIALFIVLMAIPWPFREGLGGQWI
jgi:hypothetical protein